MGGTSEEWLSSKTSASHLKYDDWWPLEEISSLSSHDLQPSTFSHNTVTSGSCMIQLMYYLHSIDGSNPGTTALFILACGTSGTISGCGVGHFDGLPLLLPSSTLLLFPFPPLCCFFPHLLLTLLIGRGCGGQ